MSSSKKSQDEPEKDPYEVLGIEFSATESDVTKSYRKLALKYHPDKQKDSSPKQLEEIAARFQEIKEARDFLLNTEKRKKYDAKRASTLARKLADKAREEKMSSQRKRMRDELAKQEAQAKEAVASKRRKAAKLEELRKEGKKMRDSYADRMQQQQQPPPPTSTSRVPSKLENIEDRQVRLKWSRKKMKISPSEHSLAQLMQAFGKVEEVEMLGKKGNAALITFVSAKSCAPCVEAYLESEEMRASFVGARKESEERAKEQKEQENVKATTTINNDRDKESIKDYQLRRAAQREELLRQMEQEEDNDQQQQASRRGQPETISQPPATTKVEKETTRNREKASVVPFPPDFPRTQDFQKCTSPFEKLELAEANILKSLLS